jgi:dTDP-4-amino-4,6-dideoxygalactose transaminase
MIPLVDLSAQYRTIKDEIDAAIQSTIDRSAYIGGDDVRQFEAEFARFCGSEGSVGVGNGTDALYLALRALGLGYGDEVITVANTFIATAEAISETGATPVFVDVLPDTLLMDPAAFEAAITSRTKAVIPVHLYGQVCDMDSILDIAGRHDIKVIEDAAQAHGARWNGKRAGTFGDLACFSFYPGKNLGAYGDGGAITGSDPELLRRVRMVANHGRLEKYTHEMPGVNSRLDGLQAGILRVKLPHLDGWNAARQRHAEHYMAALSKKQVTLPTIDPRAESVWHLFVVQVSDRTHLQKALKAEGIESGVHYPLPLHLQPAYSHLGYTAGTFPVAEQAAERILSLPIYAEMTEAQVEQIAAAVNSAVPALA